MKRLFFAVLALLMFLTLPAYCETSAASKMLFGMATAHLCWMVMAGRPRLVYAV
jgi:hypothetical protein